jgi:hypothetical protein
MYAKLFSSITDSTIWREPDSVRIVWITMLAMADKHGHVQASVPGLSDRARVPMDGTVAALKILSSPDEWSRSKEHDGRRIEVIGGGWRLLNYSKYAKIKNEEERREYMRNYMRKRRVKVVVSSVNDVNPSKPQLTHIDVNTDTDVDSKVKTSGHPLFKQVADYCKERGNLVDPTQWFNHYEANGWKIGRNPMKDWKAAVRTWERSGNSDNKTPCAKHPDSGLTQWGTCFACYLEKNDQP